VIDEIVELHERGTFLLVNVTGRRSTAGRLTSEGPTVRGVRGSRWPPSRRSPPGPGVCPVPTTGDDGLVRREIPARGGKSPHPVPRPGAAAPVPVREPTTASTAMAAL
jgi:hypothetical protein